MEDPWANAWGEPTKPDGGPRTTWAPSTTPSPTNDVQDSEIDIAMPSWATGAGVKWTEPSDAQDSLWDASLPSKEWAASPYDNISLAKGSVDGFTQPSDSPSPEPAEPSHLSTPSPPAPLLQSVEDEPPGNNATISQPSSPTISSTKSVSPPGSPDAFGTFETGLDNDEPDTDPWSHPGAVSDAVSLNADAWGSAGWGASNSEIEVSLDKKPVDEWEEAKQQKERQDRHVPPQVLASILHQFEELSLELWPKHTEALVVQDVESGNQNWQNGIDGVESLTSVVEKIIPQGLTLPSYVHFSKTFTSKHMGESLRLTRHVATTQSSPMAIYLASKGSTAWETSVKSRPEILKDDLLPPGWRVIEKEKDVTSPATDAKKKASGGLLSFFGRRGGPASPPVASSSRSASPVRPSSSASMAVASSSVGVGAPRASVDSGSSVPTRSTTPVALSSPVKLSTTNLTASSESFPSAPATNSTPSAPPPPPQQDTFEQAPPTSAVSRFLTRFSRSKTAGSSPRNSLALSTDDLEFLSDIVPSANDEVDEASQLKELSSMIGSSPLPTKLPPPLPPPPRLLPPTRVSSNNSNAQNVVEPPRINDDFLSLFNPAATHLAGTPADSEPQSLSFAKLPTNSLIANPSSPTTPIVDESLFQAASSPSIRQSFSQFDFPSAPVPVSKTRTPFPQKRTPVAIMSTPSTATPPPNTSFAFLPPPPSSHAPPPILPPPLSIGVATSRPLTQVPLPSRRSRETSSNKATIFESADDENDFSAFQSTPVIATTSFDSSISSVFSDKSLMPSSSASTSGTKDLFDDFDDFVSSPLRTPSPPRPPAKPISFGHRPLQQPPSTRSISPTKSQPRPPRRVSRAADHQRTMSLLDIAATRQGRWPAPPSPIPNILPPPPGDTTLSTFDIFNEGSTVQGQSITAVASLGSSVSSPAAFPGSDATPRLSHIPPPPGFAILSPPQHRALSPPITSQQDGNTKPTSLSVLPTSPATATPGGLSAQDLSFFEGL